MAKQIADLHFNLDAVGLTVSTKSIPSNFGRVVIHARMINYGIEKTAVQQPGHVLFLRKDVAPHLLKNPGDIIELAGVDTNDKAGQKYNEKVAMNRAEEAAEFLLREGVDDSQIVIKPAYVTGTFGKQRPDDRRVDVMVIEPISNNFRCRMITWNDIKPTSEGGDMPALVITAIDLGLEGYFYFIPNDGEDSNRFRPNLPSPGGFLRPTTYVSMRDFHDQGAGSAQFFKLPPDMLRLSILKFIRPTPPAPTSASNTLAANSFINNVRLNWDDNRESVRGELILARMVSLRAASRSSQFSAPPIAFTSRRRGLQALLHA